MPAPVMNGGSPGSDEREQARDDALAERPMSFERPRGIDSGRRCSRSSLDAVRASISGSNRNVFARQSAHDGPDDDTELRCSQDDSMHCGAHLLVLPCVWLAQREP